MVVVVLTQNGLHLFSIDWLHERSKSRKRTQRLAAQSGIRSKLAVAAETVKPWVVILLTGWEIGLAALNRMAAER